MFGLGKKIASAVATEIKGANGENSDALEALAAAAALAAAGDGDIGSSERARGLSLIKKHKKMAAIYKEHDIEKVVDTMFKQAEDAQGRNQLARELKDVVQSGANKEICEDCYLIAKEVCSDPVTGELDPKEQVQLDKIAKLLGVNPDDFLF
jgi:tellurite resistance protein TerB